MLMMGQVQSIVLPRFDGHSKESKRESHSRERVLVRARCFTVFDEKLQTRCKARVSCRANSSEQGEASDV